MQKSEALLHTSMLFLMDHSDVAYLLTALCECPKFHLCVYVHYFQRLKPALEKRIQLQQQLC